MMEEWKEYKLGEVTIMKNGKKRPQSEGSYPVYGGNGIMDYTHDFNSEKVVIVGRVGAYCGCVFKCEDKCWVSDNAIAIFPRDIVDFQYLYYLMSTLDFHHYHIGGAQPLMTQDIIGDFNVKIPSIAQQHLIASILSSLDDKIELNRRINENLEAQAQALFKSWFVDFEPFRDGEFVESELGMIPKGWRVGKIGEICKFENGFTFKSETYNNSGNYKVITIKNVQDGYLDSNDVNSVSTIPDKMPAYCNLNIADILLSLTGNVGRCCLVFENNLLLNQRVAKITSITNNYWGYVYTLFRTSDFKERMIGIARGTAQANLSPVETAKLQIIIPSYKVLESFSVITNYYYQTMIRNRIESRRLATLRDTLLPRLMSGEIKVGDVTL